MNNNDYYAFEMRRLRDQAATRRMADSASTDPREAYKRQISDNWKLPFDLDDTTALSDAASFSDSAADTEIAFAAALAAARGNRGYTTSDDAHAAYQRRLGDEWKDSSKVVGRVA